MRSPGYFSLASVLLVGLTLLLGCQGREALIPPESPMVGVPAIHFVFHNVHGRTFATENFKGRTAVLLFIQPGQPAIQDLLRELESMQHDPALTQVEFVALLPERDPLTPPFWIGLRNSLKFGLDFTGASQRYGANSQPVLVVWDQQSIIRLRLDGFAGENFYPQLEATRELVLELERARARPSSSG